jgi:hypothetical protein
MSSSISMQLVEQILLRKRAIDQGRNGDDVVEGTLGAEPAPLLSSLQTANFIRGILQSLENLPARLGVMAHPDEKEKRRWVFSEGRTLWSEIADWTIAVERLLDAFGAAPPAFCSDPINGNRALGYLQDRNKALLRLDVPCGFYDGVEANQLADLLAIGADMEHRLRNWCQVAAAFQSSPHRSLRGVHRQRKWPANRGRRRTAVSRRR